MCVYIYIYTNTQVLNTDTQLTNKIFIRNYHFIFTNLNQSVPRVITLG